MIAPTKHPKSKTHRPLWLKRISPHVFPWGPRNLYCYLCAFRSGQCWLYNYRLAAKMGVSIRTIQLWLAWLKNHHLVHIFWLRGRQRRIVVDRYANSHDWVIAQLTFRALKPVPKSRLSGDRFEQARQRNIRAILLT